MPHVQPPFPGTTQQLGAALREHAARAEDAGIPQVVVQYIWQMADAVDGGTGFAVHHGCPDDSIPTAQCLECNLVLDAEVSGDHLARVGTVFDPALPNWSPDWED